MSPPTCMELHVYLKTIAKLAATTSRLPHHSRSLGYNRCILSFVDVKAEVRCIEYVSGTEWNGRG